MSAASLLEGGQAPPAAVTSVAVLGLGAMGSRIAARFVSAGHEVTVWNRNCDRAAEVAAMLGVAASGTPAEAVDGVDAAFVMVRDDAASRSVWLDQGALDNLPVDAVAVDASTITPSWSLELAAAAASNGRAFAESPILGSLPHVENGRAIALVGADDHVAGTVASLLSAFCERVEHVGAVGEAATMKLAANALTAAGAAAMSEVLAITRAAGIDQARVAELLPSLPMVAPQIARFLGRMQAADYTANFPIRLVSKDLGYATQLLPDPARSTVLAAAKAAFDDACEQGLGDLDIVAIDAVWPTKSM